MSPAAFGGHDRRGRPPIPAGTNRTSTEDQRNGGNGPEAKWTARLTT